MTELVAGVGFLPMALSTSQALKGSARDRRVASLVRSGAGICTLVALKYIQSMLRSRLPRVARLLIAVLVGFASPALALAHGYAHHETHEAEEHERQHSRGEGVDASRSSHGELTTELRAGSHGEDHGHPQLSRAASVRVGIPLFVVMAPTAASPIDIVHVATASLLLTAAPARAGPPHARPRQPRAPPVR